MSNDAGKYISGTLMLLLAVGTYFFGKSLISNCTGWHWINPACWLGAIGNFTLMLMTGWFAIFGILIFALPAEKVPWAILFAIMVPLAIINFFIPDPIPFIDEFIMVIISGFGGTKLLSGTKAAEKVNIF